MILEQVSPSQIEAFEDCERRWYFKSPLRIKEPQNKYAGRGQGLHTKNEAYLKTGVLPPESDPDYRLIKAGTAILPTPGPDLVVEAPVQMATWPESGGGPAGPKFFGFIDLVHARGGVPTYVDHKSIGKTKNAKTSIELLHNTQLMMYARSLWYLAPDFTFAGPKSREGEAKASREQFIHLQAFVAEWSHADVVRIQHAYIHTKNKKKTAWTREVVVERESVELFWEKKLVVIHAMAAIVSDNPVSLETVQKLRGNPESCDKYPPDGCPYRAQCGFTTQPGSRFRSVARGLTQKQDAPKGLVNLMGLKETIAAKKAENAARAAAAAAAAGGAPLPPVAAQPKLEGVAEKPAPSAAAAPAVKIATGIVPPDAVVEQWACIKCEVKLFEIEPGTYEHPKANASVSGKKCVHDGRKALTRKDVFPWKGASEGEEDEDKDEDEDERAEDGGEVKTGAAEVQPEVSLFQKKVAELVAAGLLQDAAERAAKSVLADQAAKAAAAASLSAKVAPLPPLAAEPTKKGRPKKRDEQKAIEAKAFADLKAADAKASEAAARVAALPLMTPLEQAKAAAVVMGTASEVARLTCNFVGCGRGLISGTTDVMGAPPPMLCPVHGNPNPVTVVPFFRLFIGSVPIKGPAKDYVLFEDWIAPIVKELAQDQQIATHRLIDFNKGGAFLQTYVRDFILMGGEVPKNLVMQSAYEADAKDLLAVLTPYASEIYKGV